MNNIIINIGIGAITMLAGFFLAAYLLRNKKFIDLDKKKLEAQNIIDTSKQQAKEILEETTQRAKKAKESMEEEGNKRQERIRKIKKSLEFKEENIEKKEKRTKEAALNIASYKEETRSKKNSIRQLEKQMIEKLASKTKETPQSAKEKILAKYKNELEEKEGKKLAETTETVKEEAPKIARTKIVTTIQRLCSPTSVESRVVLIKVPKDNIKGKIVGKDGRNILEIENLLEVAIVFNDLPNTISVSGYNLVTRRIAEKTIKKLIKTIAGIDEKTIRHTISEAEKETDEELFVLGKKAADKMGLDNKDKDFLRTVGRLQYRTSFGQNIMKHSMEVGWIAVMLGSELGLDINICKKGGFLHDLGKAIDQDPNVKDAHDHLTKELMSKYGFTEEMIHAAWAHHDAIAQETPEALIVKAADAISGGRPGARQDSIEKYMERIQAIDETINSFEGVKKSYTMSAGREIRVLVNPDAILDENVQELANQMAEKIEKNVTYPGKIKIKVVRRTKSLEIAK